MAGPLSNVAVAWGGILSVVETREFLLFFVQKNLAYFLPKRVIANSTELSELRALILREIGARAQLLESVALSVAAA
jgi:hypothetical protein